MICPICKNEIKEDVKFCPKCGKQIPRCPSCNKVIMKKMKFCIHDGTPLPEEIFSEFSELTEETSAALTQHIKNEAEIMSSDPETSKFIDKVPPLASTPTLKTSGENQRYCVQCGAPCPETQVLCLACQKKAIRHVTPEVVPKKKNRIVPILSLVLFLGAVVTFGYSIYSGNFTLDLFSQHVVESEKDEEEQEEDKVVTNQEKTDEEKIKEHAINRTDDTKESSEDATALDETKIADEEHDNNVEIKEKAEVGNKEKVNRTEEINNQVNISDESENKNLANDVVAVELVENFILNSDKKYFTKKDLSGFDAAMCRAACNGIYALEGRKFQNESIANYFLQFDWYIPTIEPDNFSEEMLNEYQKANRDLIVAYEKEQGYR